MRLLLADSTNADAPGSSRSETDIGEVLADVIARQDGRRVIVAAFASHIHRIQQVIDAAVAAGRTVVTLGLSMQRNVGLARALGLLHVPDHALRDATELELIDPESVLIVCTGSQGEPRAALSQMAEGTSKWVDIGASDTVVLSSHPIPGNEAAVSAVRSGLAWRGARVLHTGNLDVHTSGHGHRRELEVLHSVASAQWFVPVHGEYEHLVAHARLATGMGMPDERVLLCCDGDRIELTDDGVRRTGSVGGAHIYVDGTVGDLGATVLDERRKLAADGFVAVVVDIDLDYGELAEGAEVASMGWVEPPALFGHEAAVADAVENAVQRALDAGEHDLAALKELVARTTKRTTRDRTRRRPVIVTVVREA